jgi:prevent-host-death family protein
MKKIWQLQEAKNKLSEVVDRALKDGPQTITRRGKITAVLVSARDYEKMVQPRNSLVDFFRESPLFGVELDIERVEDYAREVQF